jgi:nicotinate-nucleotide adenylyltransferase
MKTGLPLAYPGMKIGLFGGSFDPAHEGHAHVAETALKRLGLDRVWWLVAPQNPLKPLQPIRGAHCNRRRTKRMAPKWSSPIWSSGSAARFTYQTLRALKRLYPGVAFTLIMGADNLATFRKWRNWREVAKALPVAIVARPGGSAQPKAWRAHGLDLPKCPTPQGILYRHPFRQAPALAKPAEVIAFSHCLGPEEGSRTCRLK